jgi:hypothetical protein
MKWLRILVAVIISAVVLMFIIGAMLPQQHLATASADFNATPEAVWSIVADIDDAPSWRKDLSEMVMTGETTFREVTHDGDTVEYQIEEAIPAERFVTRIISPGLPYAGSWTYEFRANDSGGCTLRITERGEVFNPMFRFLSKYAFGHSATMEHYLEELKTKIQ